MSVIYRNSTAYGQTMVYGGFTPVGTVISIMGNSAPANYLKCDGTIYNISDYPDLANYFVAQFGAANKFGGDGTATFAVPDLRGEFLRGTGTNSHAGMGNGANVGVHQDATKTPEFSVQRNTGVYNIQYRSDTQPSYYYTENADTLSEMRNAVAVSKTSSFDVVVDSQGQAPSKITSRPTNTSVLYCIAVKNIYIENGGGSSSNGHTIQDTDGNDMPNENNLQFIGLLVQDDSGNGVTTVEAAGLNQESIDDVMSAGVAGNQVASNGLVYSTDEQVVGKWVDGKPIYQRTYFSTVGKSNVKTNHGISSLDRIIKIETNFRVTNSSTVWQMAGGSFMTGTPTGFVDAWNVYFTSTQMCIDASSSGPGVGDMYITVRYTKTTD